MQIIDINKYKDQKTIDQSEIITWEDVKHYSNSKLLDTLQDFIDCFDEEEEFSGKMFYRNYIDDIVGILDERLKK